MGEAIETKKRPRILIVLMGSIGDVVRGLSVVDRLRAWEPDSHIAWLVEPACQSIVSMHPRIDQVIVFNRKKWVSGFLALRRELVSAPFDIVLDMQRHFKSGLFSLMTGASRRIGFPRANSKEGNWLFNTDYVEERGEDSPKIDVYQLFADKLGAPAKSSLTFGLEGLNASILSVSIKEKTSGPYFGLVLGSSWDSKDWPVAGYQQLILRILSEFKMTLIVLLGDSSKSEMGKRLEELVHNPRIVNLAGATSLKEMMAIIAGARICVGPDSGPAHIAGALGTPYVALFGPTPAARNAPYGSEHLALRASVACAPCSRRVCPGLGKVCMRLISAEAVFSAVCGALNVQPKGVSTEQSKPHGR